MRTRVDEMLARPLDETEADEYDRSRWGLSVEAVAEAQRQDEMFGDASFRQAGDAQ